MFCLTSEAIDTEVVRQAVVSPDCGALLVFEGLARNHFEGRRVVELRYEAFEAMAVPELEQIGAEIAGRWSGARCAIVHRLGAVPVTEPTVVIAVATPHRAACYEASRYALEQLKARVPIWKKEIYADGSAWKANAPTSP